MSNELSLAQAAALMPARNGRKTHPTTVYRWIRKGCRGVRLAGWKRGNCWFTSAEAVEQFRRDCTSKSISAPVRSSDQVSRAVSAAREQLRRKGFYGKDGNKNRTQTQEMLGLPVAGKESRAMPVVLPSGVSSR